MHFLEVACQHERLRRPCATWGCTRQLLSKINRSLVLVAQRSAKQRHSSCSAKLRAGCECRDGCHYESGSHNKQRYARQKAHAAQQTTSTADTGVRKLDARPSPTHALLHGTKPRNLQTSSVQHSAPADKLRMAPGAQHRMILAMFPDGGRTHPNRLPLRGGRWERPRNLVNIMRGMRVM
jgi:hypothetical protein